MNNCRETGIGTGTGTEPETKVACRRTKPS